jgi:hypothetical protein
MGSGTMKYVQVINQIITLMLETLGVGVLG